MSGPESLLLMVFGVSVGVPLARAFGRRIERRATLPPQMGEMMARMERMEQTIEAIAMEVERISEGQRFTTKLLSSVAESPNRLGQGSASPRGDGTYTAGSRDG